MRFRVEIDDWPRPTHDFLELSLELLYIHFSSRYNLIQKLFFFVTRKQWSAND